MRLIIGILLLVAGSYFAYDGYQMKQTSTSKIGREISAVVENITGNKVEINEETKTESDIKLFGGGGVAVAGLVLILLGLTRKSKRK